MKDVLAKRLLAASAAIGIALHATAFAGDRAVAGFDIDQARKRLGRPQQPLDCPATPAPVVDMSGIVSRYDPKDPSQSRIDPGRDAASKAQDAGLAAFAKQIDRLSDRALLTNPPDPALATCLMSQLATWARADALSENVENNDRVGQDQAIMEQAWYGAAFASALAKAGGFPAAPGPDADAVKAWLRNLGTSVRSAYSGASGLLRGTNNHRTWAGYAVAAIGVVLDDRTMLGFGRSVLHDALRSVAADGSLPAEMARGEKALTYQFFATLPLAGLVAIADRNGMPLDGPEEAALERLITFDLAVVDQPALIEDLARSKQVPAVAAFALGWNDMLMSHMARRNGSLAAAMDAMASRPGLRPAWFIFLGGDVTAAYNPGATITKAQ